MSLEELSYSPILRRSFLGQAGVGLGSLALSSLMKRELRAGNVNTSRSSTSGMAGDVLQLPHHVPTAKRVIFLCMAGGPSQFETFDSKPKLREMHGKPMPESYTKGQPIAQLQGQELKCQRPLAEFSHHGKCGRLISDFLPWHAKMADDICVVNSMVTEQINHDPAHTFMNTGTAIAGHPSMGSWVNYGLGSDTEDLPGFVVLTSQGGRNPQPIASRQWAAGFLPGRFQGVEFDSRGDPVHYLRNPAGVPPSQQRALVDTVGELNGYRNQVVDDPEITTRVAAYEMAFRMQASVPELMDISNEPREVLEMYGARPGDGSYASNCLLARRLVERGVRFIQLYHRGWDHHGGLAKYMDICCGLTDRPTWALLTDLKRRGMLDDTLVVWGGEFGRTPMYQGKGGVGRDHHIKAFSMWLAGGGVRGGIRHGKTDDLGYFAVEDVVHVRDLHATMLHVLGIDHDVFRVKHQGLETGLTGVEGARVVEEILV